MGIPIACGHCHSRFTAPDGSEGKACKCPKCGQRLTISRPPPKAADARELEKTSCPHCGANYRLPAELRGKTCKCKKCGASFTIPKQEDAAPEAPKPTPTSTPKQGGSRLVRILLELVVSFVAMMVVGALAGLRWYVMLGGGGLSGWDYDTIGRALMATCFAILCAILGCFLAMLGKNVALRIVLAIVGFLGGYTLGAFAGRMVIWSVSWLVPRDKPALGTDIGKIIYGSISSDGGISLSGWTKAGLLAGVYIWVICVVMILASQKGRST